jgi:putative glutamine amidotransferase
LDGLDAIVLAGTRAVTVREQVEERQLCRLCAARTLTLLAVDHGLHLLNTAFGGSVYTNLARELPAALQHSHRLEEGLRHAITLAGDSRLARIYGAKDLIVNSTHRGAVCRVAQGFRVSGRALDGVIEAIEAESAGWFAVGVQWDPASPSASGLDIQLFRGLLEACQQRRRSRRSYSRGRRERVLV